MINLFSFIPEILILSLILISLLIGLFYKSSKNILTGINSIGFLFIAYLFISFGDSFEGTESLLKDFNVIILSKIIIALFTSIYLLLINKSLVNESIYRYEFLLFILFATLGSFVLISSDNFLTAFIGIELQSLSLYLMAAFNTKNSQSNEAGIKYFSLGALSSGFLLFGISMVYFDNASIQFSEIKNVTYFTEIGLTLIIIALFFKVSAAPFHIWTPDVYEGSPTPVTGFFATAPKVAAACLFGRVVHDAFGAAISDWQQIMAFLSFVSMFLGAIAAIGQTNIKRLMAYSSIAHMGFALLGLSSGTQEGVQALLIYMAIYVTMNVGVFAFILNMERDGQPITDIRSLGLYSRVEPLRAAALAVLMFSLAGIPPLVGFFGKLYVLKAAINAGMTWLAISAVVASVIGAFYYLRIIYFMYFGEEVEKMSGKMPFLHKFALYGATLIMLFGAINLFGIESVAADAAVSLFK